MLDVPLSYLYCEDDDIALLLLKLHQLSDDRCSMKVQEFLLILDQL